MKKAADRSRSPKVSNGILRRRRSFLTGLASIFDFAGALQRPRRIASGPDADARAMASDWQAVGGDLWAAMGQFEKETGVRVLGKRRRGKSA